MTLEAETRIGTFEITGKIGAGGRGEVWRACDTKLERLVPVE